MSLVLFRRYPELIPMSAHCGFHTVETEADEGIPYRFRFPDGREFADPASRFQPEGVQGPSVVIDTAKFRWTDKGFAGFSPSQAVIYELHTGTFTEEGTFESAISRLESLADLGVTAVELMPVAQFPGTRNWGYDGVFPYAVQNSYGGPRGLQKFVNAAHGIGLSVILDVVYNHLGPEGNFAGEFGPYFTDRYRTPWGRAVNFDGPGSDPVRAFFIQNAIYWLKEFHIDALRLDAVHGIFDFSAHHFLAELKESVEALAQRSRRKLFVIAESDLNDARLLHALDRGDTDWTRSGATTSIMRCTHCLLMNSRATTAILARLTIYARCSATDGSTPASTHAFGGDGTGIPRQGFSKAGSLFSARITTRWGTARRANGSYSSLILRA